jgi:hypothetical protein
MKQEDYKRQLVIANSLYEMGIDIDLIKRITTVSSEDLAKYRDKNKIKRKDIDNKNNKDI